MGSDMKASKPSIEKPGTQNKSWRTDLPFPQHWLGYLALKIIIILVAALVVLHFSGVL
jgi:hypothetical protein